MMDVSLAAALSPDEHRAVLCSTAAAQRHIIRRLMAQNSAIAQEIASLNDAWRLQRRSPPGFTSEQLADLPRVAGPCDEQCCICLDDLRDDECAQLPCGHILHRSCVSKWLVMTPLCPLCKSHAVSQAYSRNERHLL